jgi:hypothetical protein
MEISMTTSLQSTDIERLSKAGLRAFFRIADLWKLSRDQQMNLLGLRPTATGTYHNWKKNQDVSLDRDTLDRLSYILGIFRALEILLPQSEMSDSWIHRPNKGIPFGGRTPLDLMLEGKIQNLLEVREYLDDQRGT